MTGRGSSSDRRECATAGGRCAPAFWAGLGLMVAVFACGLWQACPRGEQGLASAQDMLPWDGIAFGLLGQLGGLLLMALSLVLGYRLVRKRMEQEEEARRHARTRAQETETLEAAKQRHEANTARTIAEQFKGPLEAVTKALIALHQQTSKTTSTENREEQK